MIIKDLFKKDITRPIQGVVTIGNENEEQKASYIQLLILVKNVLEQCIDLLGFQAPEKM